MLLLVSQGIDVQGDDVDERVSRRIRTGDHDGYPRWVGIAVAALAGVSLLGLGIGWSALSHANNVEQTTQSSVKQANEALAQKLAKEDEINQQLQSDLKVVTDKLNVT